MLAALTESARAERIGELTGWDFDEERGSLHRRVDFVDFSEAWSFMSRVALLAEQLDHHPEWLNEYNRLDIWLKTHDIGGVTGRDFVLARAIDAIIPAGA